MDNKVYIDIERVSDSLETLSYIENLVNYSDLSGHFDDLDQYFKKINFEHANCLYYKDSLDAIYDNLDFVKRKINELVDYLRKAKILYTSTNEIEHETDSPTFNSLSASLHNIFESNITKIPPEPTIGTTTQENSSPINTVPIGIAIGATGIAGSIGAVVINGIATSYNDYELEDYHEPEELIEPQKVETKPKKVKIEEEKESEYIEPYQAVRNEREADKFYGNQFDIVLEDEPEEEYYNDDFFE